MRIALNARHMMNDRLEGLGTVTHEIMQRIVKSHPEERFDYYFDRPYQPQYVHGPNVMPHVFGPPARLPGLIRYWNKYPVRRDIIRQHSDVFFSPDGFVPLDLAIPKVSMIHDAAFHRYPEYFIPRIRNFYKNWMAKYIDHTDHIITVSQYAKGDLMAAYNIPEEKISVVYNGVSSGYQPMNETEIQAFRDQYTGGKPYFLYLGSIHPRKNVITLVHAFEQFKSMTNHDAKLVIAGRASWDTNDVYKAVRESKWKNEIHMVGFVDGGEKKYWLSAAEALVYPSLYEGFGLPLLEAMASGVPVISSNSSSLPEVGGDAALYFNPMDVEELVHHMNTIALNQNVRQDLVAKGYKRIKEFSWDKAAEETYRILKGQPKNNYPG